MTEPTTCGPEISDAPHRALLRLLERLDSDGYAFIPPTPATYGLVCARRNRARDLRDVFGWSLPFKPDLFDAALMDLLEEAQVLQARGEVFRSRVRVSRLGGRLYLHSAHPTEDKDAVFLGPDSYRFARFIRASLKAGPAPRLVLDLGAGAGVGGLTAGALCPDARVVLIDVNARALRLAAVNAAFAGRTVETWVGSVETHDFAAPDLVLANPPFMLDAEDRTYRNGGRMHGAQLSLDWTLHAARRLSPGGRAILYTGSAIVDGRDGLRDAMAERLPELGCTFDYEEIDPDIFGEELSQPGYQDVERIAAVGAVVTRG